MRCSGGGDEGAGHWQQASRCAAGAPGDVVGSLAAAGLAAMARNGGEAMGEAKASKGKRKSKAKLAPIDAAIDKAIKAIAKEPACRCNNAASKHLEAAKDWRSKRDAALASRGG